MTNFCIDIFCSIIHYGLQLMGVYCNQKNLWEYRVVERKAYSGTSCYTIIGVAMNYKALQFFFQSIDHISCLEIHYQSTDL